MTETSMVLDRIWDELELGIRRDLRRARNRRRIPAVASVAAVAAVGSVATIAAATDLWSGSPAPAHARQALSGYSARDVAGVPPEILKANNNIEYSAAIEVARSGSHILYAAPTKDGGYCITDDAETGLWCPTDSAAAIDYALGGGTDRRWKGTPGFEFKGGVIFGRVADSSATSVEIKLPGGVAPAHATIGKNGFFITELPAEAWWANQNHDAPVGPATAYDAHGEVVATSPALPPPSVTRGHEGATPNTLLPNGVIPTPSP